MKCSVENISKSSKELKKVEKRNQNEKKNFFLRKLEKMNVLKKTELDKNELAEENLRKELDKQEKDRKKKAEQQKRLAEVERQKFLRQEKYVAKSTNQMCERITKTLDDMLSKNFNEKLELLKMTSIKDMNNEKELKKSQELFEECLQETTEIMRKLKEDKVQKQADEEKQKEEKEKVPHLSDEIYDFIDSIAKEIGRDILVLNDDKQVIYDKKGIGTEKVVYVFRHNTEQEGVYRWKITGDKDESFATVKELFESYKKNNADFVEDKLLESIEEEKKSNKNDDNQFSNYKFLMPDLVVARTVNLRNTIAQQTDKKRGTLLEELGDRANDIIGFKILDAEKSN